ncbi:hypothetical protein ACFO5O_15015 [Geojedonia litorea]|uniref:Uncharacterized protein n=1 Tax=Geojedonia litorea TaxID=1268269 RepID=A0ABV9N9J2_9FLAO
MDQCSKAKFEIGSDVGILFYNDKPLKRFTYKGISVVSAGFKKFGSKVAEFVTSDKLLQTYLSTKLILRDSL